MEKQKEVALLICTLAGGIADIIAIIIAIKSISPALPFLIIAFVILVCVVVYLYSKYKERCDFINFIQYLFNNNIRNFNLLPKICLALDKTEETNKLFLKKMTVEYTYDMRSVNTGILSHDTPICYSNTIECHLEAENRNIPKEYVIYRGNMKADDSVEIMQKHGSQAIYEAVSPPRYTDETRVDIVVQRYCWQLKRENITKGRSFPISFKFKYSEKSVANSNSTIVLYPKQYAKSIEVIDFKICFLCEKDILKRVELFKVWKDDKCFKHTPITGVTLSNNVASIVIEPDTLECEAYYFRLYWELI